jgi:hypothetical protein
VKPRREFSLATHHLPVSHVARGHERGSQALVRLHRSPIVAMMVLFSATARADVSSWLALGGGYGLERSDHYGDTLGKGAFSALIGVGTTPRASLVVGGVFRSLSNFNTGTSLSLSARFASGGFARGDWGLGVDLGPAVRWWSAGNYWTAPLQGVVTLGLPWGLEVGVGVDMWNLGGTSQSRGGFALLELDLLRLTVMRQGSTDHIWRNPSPAGGREGD